MNSGSDNKDCITREDFVRLLFDKDPKELAGLIPSENLYYASEEIDRRSAAALIHIFLREIHKEPDITDITPASILRDLYDCRVCVDHIAQVYLKGIMESFDYKELSKTGKAGEFLLFDGLKKVTSKEAAEYRDRVLNRAQRLKNPTK